jgi:hypothetical protein
MASRWPSGLYSGDSLILSQRTANLERLICDSVNSTTITGGTIATTNGLVSLTDSSSTINGVSVARGIAVQPMYIVYTRLTNSALYADETLTPVVFSATSSEISNNFNSIYSGASYNTFHSTTSNPSRFYNPFTDKYAIFDIQYNVSLYQTGASSGARALVNVSTSDGFTYLRANSDDQTLISYNGGGKIKVSPSGYFSLNITKKTLPLMPNYNLDVYIDMSVTLVKYE